MSELNRYLSLLPQKPPVIYLDHLIELQNGYSATATVCFPAGHRIFEGHLPGRPLVPGVILIEAMAQLSGLAVMPDEGQPVSGFLAEVQRMRFRRLVAPQETITLRSVLACRLGSAARFEVSAEVGGDPVAVGVLTIGGMSH